MFKKMVFRLNLSLISQRGFQEWGHDTMPPSLNTLLTTMPVILLRNPDLDIGKKVIKNNNKLSTY